MYATVNAVIIGSENGLSHHQAITRASAHLLTFVALRRNFRKIIMKNQIFSFKKMQLKMPSQKVYILIRHRYIHV